MQEDAALQQRETSLPIRTAFDPLQFVVEPLDHPIAPRFGAGVGDCHSIIGQALHKADQFLDPRGAHSRFPLVQPALAFALAQQLAKVLRKRGDEAGALRVPIANKD